MTIILRAILWLLMTVLLIGVLRHVIGWLARSFTNYALGPKVGGGAQKRKVSQGGVLHKDPMCGTYVGEGAAVVLREGGQTVYFCSEECKAKYAARG
jgi:YHS domain-containing protein